MRAETILDCGPLRRAGSNLRAEPRSMGVMKHSTPWFSRFSKWTARVTGRPVTFALAVASLVVWAAFGPVFHFSNTWQLVINTGTTIITFLMVFLIQSTQNRESA